MRMHEPGFLLWDLIDNKKLSVGFASWREMDIKYYWLKDKNVLIKRIRLLQISIDYNYIKISYGADTIWILLVLNFQLLNKMQQKHC